MIDLILPPADKTSINLKFPDGKDVAIEIIDIVDDWNTAKSEASKVDAEWMGFFVSAMKRRGIDITKTSAVLLVEVAVRELANLKNSCCPEQGQ